MQLATRIREQFKQSEVRLVASSLAFYTALSIIPFLAVALGIIQKIGGLDTLYPKVEQFLLSNFSDTAGIEGVKLIKGALKRMMSGKLGLLGAGFLIFTSTRLLQDMENSINRVWNIKNKRPLVKRVFVAWLVIFVFPFLLALYVAYNSVFKFSSGTHFMLLVAFLFALYKFAPAQKVSPKSAAIASFAGGVITACVHKFFTLVTMQTFAYGKLYGGIAAFPLILLWILAIWYAILVGAIICASLED